MDDNSGLLWPSATVGMVDGSRDGRQDCRVSPCSPPWQIPITTGKLRSLHLLGASERSCRTRRGSSGHQYERLLK